MSNSTTCRGDLLVDRPQLGAYDPPSLHQEGLREEEESAADRWRARPKQGKALQKANWQRERARTRRQELRGTTSYRATRRHPPSENKMAVANETRGEDQPEDAGVIIESLPADADPLHLQGEPSAANNDPWRRTDDGGGGGGGGGGGDNDGGSEAAATNAFSDDFKPFVRLPDSDEYLASLESKLARVQKKGSMVRDLQSKREDAMRRFLDDGARGDGSAMSSTEVRSDGERGEEDTAASDLATPVIDNAVVRKIAPEKQVINGTSIHHTYIILTKFNISGLKSRGGRDSSQGGQSRQRQRERRRRRE